MNYEKVLGEHKFPTYEELKSGLIRLIDEGKISREDAARLLPELRESEDERIRKEIIDFLETIPASELKRIPRPISEWFSWLEKQKESHIPWYDYQKSKEAGYTIVPNEEYEQLIKQKEQKLIEKSHITPNKEFLQWIYDRLVYVHGENPDVDYMRSFKDRIEEIEKEQKPAEWSEEDKDMLNSCISSIEEAKENRYAYKETDGDTSYDREIDWLKSLRPSWKPSEEQMDALKELIDDANRAGWVTPGATELYEQLKKL